MMETITHFEEGDVVLTTMVNLDDGGDGNIYGASFVHRGTEEVYVQFDWRDLTELDQITLIGDWDQAIDYIFYPTEKAKQVHQMQWEI